MAAATMTAATPSRCTAALVAAAVALLVSPQPAAATSLRLRSLQPSVVFGSGGHAIHGLHGMDLVALGETVLVDSFLICIGVAISSLIVLCLWSAVSQWCHWAYFRACERKLKRVNEAFGRRHGELPLCPYCVEPISTQPSPSKVVFLCGHRFHTHCVNAWCSSSQSDSVSNGSNGRCPICEDAADSAASAESGDQQSNDDSADDGCNDEAQTFILASLHRQFPEIVSEDCVQRWANCHTQIWLSEMCCPRPKCILHKQRPR
mmetsp:Transcript_138269/g.359334  ORF Transcript_138269/g.359334 Transcript_138269/m.359334 type:complete len:262 (+) Transcript_138269:91-876(+)